MCVPGGSEFHKSGYIIILLTIMLNAYIATYNRFEHACTIKLVPCQHLNGMHAAAITHYHIKELT